MSATATLDEVRVTDQNQRASRLSPKERALNALFEHSPTYTCIGSGRRHIVGYANPSFHELVGHRELLGFPLAESLPEIVEQGMVEVLDHVFESGEAYVQEEMPLQVQRHPGAPLETRYINFVYSAVLGSDESVAGVLMHGVDITHLVASRNAAERATRRFKALVDSSDQFMWKSDVDGAVQVVGKTWTEFTHTPLETSNGSGWMNFVHPDDLLGVAEAWSYSLNTLEPYRKNFRLLCHDGSYHWIEVRGVPVYDSSGEHVEWIGTGTNIHEKKVAQEERRRSEVELQVALEATGLGVWSRDMSASDVQLSERACEIFGVPCGSVLEADEIISSNIHPEDRATVVELTHHAIEVGTPFDVVYRVQRPGGAIRWLQSKGKLERDEEGNALRLVGTVDDISDRKEYEAELINAREAAEEMARLKDAFLANMSHELRTPLTSIIGYSELLKLEAAPELAEMAGYIHSNGERLMATLNLILELAQLQSGLLRLSPREIDIVDHVHSLAGTFVARAQDRGVALKLEHRAAAIPAWIDPMGVSRIVTHLLSNALKFTAEGCVAIAVRRSGAYAEIEVADTGIGLDPDVVPRLFNEFRQESAGLSRDYEGTGIGLTITSKLVRMMGGTIAVTSTKGGGTTFTVRLPTGIEQSPFHRYKSEETLPKLLAVEDREDARFLLERMLTGEVEITYAVNADEALEAVREQKFDLVLMDIHLGDGIDGEELLRVVRSLPAGDDLPIVACTAYALPGDRERLLRAGFDGYLSKPFKQDALLQTIRSWLHSAECTRK